jgi:hypothetical protein
MTGGFNGLLVLMSQRRKIITIARSRMRMLKPISNRENKAARRKDSVPKGRWINWEIQAVQL